METASAPSERGERREEKERDRDRDRERDRDRDRDRESRFGRIAYHWGQVLLQSFDGSFFDR